jgi:hypothetical protein
MTTTTADASTSFSQNIESNLTLAIYFLGKKYDLQKFFFSIFVKDFLFFVRYFLSVRFDTAARNGIEFIMGVPYIYPATKK